MASEYQDFLNLRDQYNNTTGGRYDFGPDAYGYWDKTPSNGGGYDEANRNTQETPTSWIWNDTPAAQAAKAKYGSMLQGISQGNEGRFSTGLSKIDTSKLPQTKFGDALMVMNYKPQDQMNGAKWRDPSRHYIDPNYGDITDQSNFMPRFNTTDKIGQMLPQAAMAAAGAGFGSLMGPGIPALMNSLIGGARTFGDSGDWKKALINILPGLIGAGAGGLTKGLPTDFMKYLNYAKTGYGVYNSLHGRRG